MSTVEEPPVVSSSAPRRNQAGGSERRSHWFLIAAALVLVGLGAIVTSLAFDKPHAASVLGPNLAVNDGARNALDLSANNSPGLVQSPVDAANLVEVNRVDSPAYSCSVSVSFDGGGRWTHTPIPAPSDRSAGTRCYAPDAAFGVDGTLYLTFVTLKGRANAPEAAWITRSRDGGKTLTAPVRMPLPPHAFQVRVTADAKVRGRIYLTWLQAGELGLYQFASTGNPIQSIRSDDAGQTWSAAVRISDAGRLRAVAPAPVAGAAAGELYVAYLDLGEDSLDYAGGHEGQGGPPYDGKWSLVLARSTDKGATWKESVVDAAIVPTERFIVFTPPYPAVTVDRRSGDVYTAFHDGRDGDPDVRLWRLPKGASRWDGPVRVNDTRRGDGTAQYLPTIAVAPNGRVDVVYYDRRSDRSNILNDVSLQSSFDEGESFTARLKLSDKAFSSRIGSGLERDLADLGSRLGLISADTRAYAVWTDTRAGSLRTGKQDIARSVVAFNEPARLSGVAKTLLRGGGGALIVLALVVGVALGTGPRRSPRRR